MISATQIRNGIIIMHEGQPHRVMNFRFTVQGRGSNQISCKMRNILTGSKAEYRFRSDDKVEEIELDLRELEFLYSDSDQHWFMDTENFEQIPLTNDEAEDVILYLLPNTPCKGQFYEGKCIGITPPNTVQLKVTETEPQIKGATASGNVQKPATGDRADPPGTDVHTDRRHGYCQYRFGRIPGASGKAIVRIFHGEYTHSGDSCT